MTRLAERTAVKLSLGKFDLIVQDLEGGGTRRIVKHRAIGVDGADLQDMGEDERTDAFSAIVSDAMASDLEDLKKQAKKITVCHPLFGTYQGRIERLTYKANSKEGCEISITVLEDGIAATRITGVTVTLPTAAGSARAAWGDASSVFDSFDDFDDIPSDLTSAVSALSSAWDSFDDVLTAVEVGVQTWRELSASMASMGSLVDDVISAADSALETVVGFSEVALEDSLYPLMRSARMAVDAARSTTSAAWQAVSFAVPSSIGQVARAIYGADDDASCDLVASYLPDRIDYAWLDAGTRITLPVGE